MPASFDVLLTFFDREVRVGPQVKVHGIPQVARHLVSRGTEDGDVQIDTDRFPSLLPLVSVAEQFHVEATSNHILP